MSSTHLTLTVVIYIVDFCNITYLLRFVVYYEQSCVFSAKGQKYINPGQIQDRVKSRTRPRNKGRSCKIEGHDPSKGCLMRLRSQKRLLILFHLEDVKCGTSRTRFRTGPPASRRAYSAPHGPTHSRWGRGLLPPAKHPSPAVGQSGIRFQRLGPRYLLHFSVISFF